MKLVELARYARRVEADLARLRLESEGIEAVILDAEMNYVLGELRLMVLEEDLTEAAAILAEGRST
ncbi:MAG: putative signal transducing protein [Sphingomicrobium sp.]